MISSWWATKTTSASVMTALGESPQGYSSKFPTLVAVGL
jgi:hypothetical protein